MDYTELHQPVLLEAVITALAPQPRDRYLDLTGGAGSHAESVLHSSKDIVANIVDRDQQAINLLQHRFASNNLVTVSHDTMASFVKNSTDNDITYDLVLADLGLSSMQLELGRGFSISDSKSMLSMEMGLGNISANEVVNTYGLDSLRTLLEQYGEIGNARKLAQSIIDARPIADTENLVGCISSSYRGAREGRSRYLARVFQAIRIEANDELGNLRVLLESIDQLVNPGGRVAIISFHSLEDGLVKKRFKDLSRDAVFGGWSLIQPYPVRGREFDTNPRARSAVLRALVKKPK